jgi:raffinose/stachyose/melibiose transport system substrate-binding protein
MCRPFDSSLKIFKAGVFDEITEMQGIENFPSFTQSPWQTRSGAQTYCLPMASVIHGFFYNKTIFKELGLSEPQTRDEFYRLLDNVKSTGQYQAMSMSVKDKWVSATLGYQNIGPNYWKGEDGRAAVIDGSEQLNEKPYQQVFSELRRWVDYLGPNYQKVSYGDSIDAFKSGNVAVYPAGSWGITTFRDDIDLGVFKPPVINKGDECYVSDHTDIGMGINANSQNKEASMRLLQWMTTAEFAELLTNSLPGFFSLSNHFIEVNDPTAATMLSWRTECDSTIRSTAQHLSSENNNLEDQVWEATFEVMMKQKTPVEAADRLQTSLASWYLPQINAKNDECN